MHLKCDCVRWLQARDRKLRIFADADHPFKDHPRLVAWEPPHRALRRKRPLWELPDGFEPFNPEVEHTTGKVAEVSNAQFALYLAPFDCKQLCMSQLMSASGALLTGISEAIWSPAQRRETGEHSAVDTRIRIRGRGWCGLDKLEIGRVCRLAECITRRTATPLCHSITLYSNAWYLCLIHHITLSHLPQVLTASLLQIRQSSVNGSCAGASCRCITAARYITTTADRRHYSPAGICNHGSMHADITSRCIYRWGIGMTLFNHWHKNILLSVHTPASSCAFTPASASDSS